MTFALFKQGLALRSEATKGQTLIELLLAIALATLLLPALLTGLVASREGKAQQGNKLSGAALLKEGTEAVRQVREAGWINVATNGTYHPVRTGGIWTLGTGSETIDIFTRTVTIVDTLRDANGAIVSSGGTNDPSTKRVTVAIAWLQPFTHSIQTTLYLSRWLGNTTFTHTSQADFSAGTTTNTTITNTSGGEVTLGAGGGGNWCEPNLSIATVDLPKQGVANAVSAVQGQVSAGTGENASGVSYARVVVSDTDPPVATVSGTYDGYKTNDIWTDGTNTYIATDNNGKEVVILDVSQSTVQEVGYFNTPSSNANASAVFVSGNRGYVAAGFFLYVFDLSSKTGSRPILGLPFLLLGTGTSIVVRGNYAYVSVANSLIELQIVDITNPFNIWQIGYADVNGQDGKRVFVNETAIRAYLATGVSATLREFFIIDTSQKSGARPTLGSYDASGMGPNNLAVVPGNRAILVGSGGEEYQVLDITNEAAPVRCGGLHIDNGVNGVTSVLESDGDAYSYIITGDASSELKIIEGGPGGQFTTSGTFESANFDAGSEVAFNRFTGNAIVPAQTTVTYQIAGADPVSGSCTGATFTFVGPDGTSGQYFSQSASIPLSNDGSGFENPARCLRYRVYLSTSEIFTSPSFTDITVNYSL